MWSFTLSRWVRLGPQLVEDLPAWVDEDGWTVEIPTYILYGSRDEVVPKSASEEFVARNPKAVLIIVDDDHKLSEAATFNSLERILMEFLDKP
jgi:pimeloyl-ACP methyl ester carboxylesterase